MGPSVWEALLRLLGDCPSLPFPQRSDGKTEQDTHDRGPLVRTSRLYFLIGLGPDRSVLAKANWSDSQTVRGGMLILLLDFI